MVNRLIQQEMRRFTPPDYLAKYPLPELRFIGHKMLQDEYERVRKKRPMPTIDISRYKLEQPSSALRHDLNAWRKCSQNAQAQLEHQSNRILNLQLLRKYGADSWRAQNTILTSAHQRLQDSLKQKMASIDDINRERRVAQEQVKQELARLKRDWWQAIDSNHKTETACAIYEREIKRLRSSAR